MQAQQKKLNLKFQTSEKTKRVRDVPPTFQALKQTVEALLKEQKQSDQIPSTDYIIKYVDKDDEMINVSDDEDLFTAYEVVGGGDLVTLLLLLQQGLYC